MYAVTGATGQLGRLVIETLSRSVPSDQIVALARDPAKASDLAAGGVRVRHADYDRPATLAPALAGVRKLLLISGTEQGARVAQHQATIDAAKAAGVELIAYTSVLHADRSPLGLAEDHRRTEAALAASGLPSVILRNGWYTENHLAGLEPALAHGAVLGAAKGGRIASAARRDYAEAAAAVLLAERQAGRVYELAGDDPWTLTDLAAAIARRSGRSVVYKDLPQAAYEDVLLHAGLPPFLAALVADADARAADGALFDDSRDLSGLIGRPTTSMPAMVDVALASAGKVARVA